MIFLTEQPCLDNDNVVKTLKKRRVTTGYTVCPTGYIVCPARKITARFELLLVDGVGLLDIIYSRLLSIFIDISFIFGTKRLSWMICNYYYNYYILCFSGHTV